MRLFIFILAVMQLDYLVAHVKVKRENSYCVVQEHVFSQKFNFTLLSNPDKDYSIQHDPNVILRLQLCEDLRQSCNGQGGYSICLSKNGQEIGIGKNPPIIAMEFGEIIFKYTGDKCDEFNNYTVDIRMQCDFGNAGIELFAPDFNTCDFKMDWKTAAACTKPKKINCTIDNKSGHYDLNELTNLSENYEVFVNQNISLILNVCHSIIYGKNTCKSNNAACLINATNWNAVESSGKSMPLGEPVDDLKYNDDGTLSLTYTGGAICNSNNNEASSHFQTTITFICDLDAIGTLPHYTGGMELCHYQLNWTTSAACSEQALHIKSIEKANSDVCTVKNPITGQIYNLTSLMNREFKVRPFGINEVFKFNICNALTNTSCKKATGACRLYKSVSGGIGNADLMWKESGPYLNYTNGNLCFNNQQRYTILEFSCGPEDYEIDENALCFDVIKISTPLVCKEQESCSTYNNEVNFDSLIRKSSNYVVKSDNTEYHINLCRSLFNDNKLHLCTNEKASICKVTVIDGKLINETNLGSFNNDPITTNGQSAVVVYRNGSVCKEDKRRRIESNISFLCDINSQMTQPQFKSYKDCTYFFEWKTSLVCGNIDGYFNENCSLNNSLGDYRSLLFLSKYNVLTNPVIGKNNSHYKMSICGNKKDCNGGFICDTRMNYGTQISVHYNYSKSFESIRLHFTGGSKCSDGSLAQSIYNINCRENYPSSPPVIVKETPCYLEFDLDTREICRPQNITRISTSTYTENGVKNVVPNESNSLNGGAIVGMIIAILIIIMAIFYLQNDTRRIRLIEMISNSATRNLDTVKYSRVNTTEEVHLLLKDSDPTVTESESDDDELLDA